jgi:hypothetical protein
VQCAASDQLAVVGLGDPELLHVFVEHDEVFAEQDALLHERFDEPLDAADVGRARAPHRVPAHVHPAFRTRLTKTKEIRRKRHGSGGEKPIRRESP